MFSVRKLNASSSILERKERFQPTRSNNVFKHKPGPDCNQPEGTECDYYANIVTPHHSTGHPDIYRVVARHGPGYQILSPRLSFPPLSLSNITPREIGKKPNQFIQVPVS